MRMRVKKWPVLVPVILLAVLLLGVALSLILRGRSSGNHTDLGEKYLADLDYSGAVTAFAEGLAQDPTDTAARLGLARSYLGLGEEEEALELLQPLLDSGDPDAYRALADYRADQGDTGEAVIAAYAALEQTDSDEDYDRFYSLLDETLGAPHSYAAGTDQQLLIDGGALYSMGSNRMGQLGTGAALGTGTETVWFQDAGFPATPERVFCAGRTSYVVDTDGNLWAAGENRWGQMGTGSIQVSLQPGWTEIMDSGDVAAAAGTAGTLFVLKTDGSLWYAGAGGVTSFTPMADVGAVVSLASEGSTVAALTAGGTLYTWNTSYNSSWSRVADGVKSFFLCNGVLTWVTTGNEVCCSGYWPELPSGREWTYGSVGVIPDFTVKWAASDGWGLLLSDCDGELYRLYGDELYEVRGMEADGVYPAGGVVVETDGELFLWDLSLPDPTQIAR